ncbi:hypothetical protein ARMSODRAFT_562249 [Armillaria solidipes]|uniref:Uncharacterized protein n=1 Tax=Armillaria solidipes TaxID=1076256 RepID=A0A2H3AVT3_9AGAR|nr:hypothetical protein ARMSODRAFT_562249 [Armillaria solidipes]
MRGQEEMKGMANGRRASSETFTHDHFIFYGHYLAMIPLFQDIGLSRIGHRLHKIRYTVQSFISYASPAYNLSSDHSHAAGDKTLAPKENNHGKLRLLSETRTQRGVWVMEENRL